MLQSITKKRIEELQQQNKNITLIDIRPEEEYDQMHVPGSLNLPANMIENDISKFSTNDTIVCVCTKGMERSQNAAKTISSLGFENVFYLEEGVMGWLNK